MIGYTNEMCRRLRHNEEEMQSIMLLGEFAIQLIDFNIASNIRLNLC